MLRVALDDVVECFAPPRSGGGGQGAQGEDGLGDLATTITATPDVVDIGVPGSIEVTFVDPEFALPGLTEDPEPGNLDVNVSLTDESGTIGSWSAFSETESPTTGTITRVQILDDVTLAIEVSIPAEAVPGKLDLWVEYGGGVCAGVNGQTTLQSVAP